ncbi:MAG: hypothetical protein ABI183_12470 [Polyangiaceae bacterium]
MGLSNSRSPSWSSNARRPRGYIGTAHQTIGSDITALLKAVLMPEQMLGKEVVSGLRQVEGHKWYPIAMLLDPLDRLDQLLGESSLRKIGWTLFEQSHEKAMRAAKVSVRAITYGIDGMYHRANRGQDIGGWRVVTFEPGEAVLEKNTPHNCIMEEGILEAGCRVAGVVPTIFQSECIRNGGVVCRFVIRSHVVDERWNG